MYTFREYVDNNRSHEPGIACIIMNLVCQIMQVARMLQAGNPTRGHKHILKIFMPQD